MNSVVIPCSCGSKDCVTKLVIEIDEENKANLRLIIEDTVHDCASWISLDKSDLVDLVQVIHKKYGRLEK